MGSPTTTQKHCPKCGKKCEKCVLFQHEWYWRCPNCKIDADSYKESNKRYSDADYWGNETTQEWKLSKTIREFDISSCSITNIITTRDSAGNEVAEVTIRVSYTIIPQPIFSTPTEEIFKESFHMGPKNGGTEHDMWIDVANLVLKSTTLIYFQIDEIKKEYLVFALKKKYPFDTVQFK